MTEHTKSQVGRYQQMPLVGRTAEQERLRHFLLETERFFTSAPSWTRPERKSFVLLVGEVGIGKTRLAEELAREALQRTWLVLWSRVYAQESGVPYRLWSQVLRDIVQRALWPSHLDEAQIHLYQPLTTLLPELSDLLAAHTVDPAPISGQDKQRLREALLALLIAIAKQQGEPLLIVLDDLQWADESSCELLAYLVRRLVDHPVLLIGTMRENVLSATHPLWALVANTQHESIVEQVHVEALTDEQIATLVAHIPQSLAQLIQSQVAGNPFFAEELARTYSVWGEGEKTQYEQDRLKLPRTIADVLDQRVQLLSTACQGFLQRAAVTGGSLSFESLYLMENGGNSTLDEEGMFKLIEEALQAKVLTEEKAGSNVTFHFWHPLLMSHLYEKLSVIRRRRLHQRASEVFQQIYMTREVEGAAIIVHHLLQGGADAQQIAQYATLAADYAYALAAYPAAEKYYRLAIEHCKHERIMDADARLQLALQLESLGECQRFQGNFQGAGDCFAQALDLHRQVYPVLSKDMVQEAQIQAMLCCGIGISWHDRGDCAQARTYYATVEGMLNAMEIVGGTAWAYLHLQYSYTFWQEGNYEEAQKAAYEALNLFEVPLQKDRASRQQSDKNRLRRTLAGDPVDLGRTYRILGLLASAVGQLTQVHSYYMIALKIFEQYDCLREIAMICCDLGDLHLRRAEHASAEQYLLRALDIAERIGEAALECFIVGNLGQRALRMGNLTESETWYRRGIKKALQINNIHSICFLFTSLAFVLQEQGKYAEVAPCLRRVFSLQRDKGIPTCTAMMWLILGYVRLSRVQAQYGLDIPLNDHKTKQCLIAARNAVEIALVTPGIDIDIRIEATLLQGYILLLLNRVEEGFHQARYAFVLAYEHELKWLVAYAKRLIALIQARRGEVQEADIYFKQARELFATCNMELEHARTLQLYGMVLLQREKPGAASHQQGLSYVQEARKFFVECHAAVDLQAAECLG